MSLQFRDIEKAKIKCAKKLFNGISRMMCDTDKLTAIRLC